MRSCVVLLFASLLTLCEAQGTFVTPVFVLKGRDLLLKLHAHPPEGFLFVDWKINKKVNLVRFDPSGEANVLHNVTGRVQLGENKFSVILKNVQEVDSGVYSVVAVTLTGDKLLTEYKVTVQGPVSPVELIVDRVDNSSESCDLHVTCRTHNSDISRTFRCVDWFRSQEGGEVTTSGASLQVYLLNNVIICNHSNQVHWTQDLIHAEQLCYPSTDPLRGWVIAVCVLVVVLVITGGVIVCLYICQKRLNDIIQRLGRSDYKDGFWGHYPDPRSGIPDAIKGYQDALDVVNKFVEEENRIREEERRREEENRRREEENRRREEENRRREEENRIREEESSRSFMSLLQLRAV